MYSCIWVHLLIHITACYNVLIDLREVVWTYLWMETSGITSGNHDIYTGIKIHLHVVERTVTVINVKKKKLLKQNTNWHINTASLWHHHIWTCSPQNSVAIKHMHKQCVPSVLSPFPPMPGSKVNIIPSLLILVTVRRCWHIQLMIWQAILFVSEYFATTY